MSRSPANALWSLLVVFFFFGRFCRKIAQNLWAHTQRHEAHGADAGTWCSLPKCVCPEALRDSYDSSGRGENKMLRRLHRAFGGLLDDLL